MTIDRFASALIKGGARNSLFKVTGNIGTVQVNEQRSFLIKAASLPASTITEIPVPFRGRTVKIPGNRTFDNWTITVIADGDLSIRKEFERWGQQINNNRTNRPGVTNESFKPFNSPVYTDWFIEQLGRDEKPIHKYKFVGCWPTSISPIEVSYESDGIIEFTVDLAYTYFETL